MSLYAFQLCSFGAAFSQQSGQVRCRYVVDETSRVFRTTRRLRDCPVVAPSRPHLPSACLSLDEALLLLSPQPNPVDTKLSITQHPPLSHTTTGTVTNLSAPTQIPNVYLVGTGPGDPGLLTLRAVQLMRHADVVLYDRLVSPDILRFVGDTATMIYVGKQKSFHTRTQPEIHTLLHQFATTRPGATILRLKGGDPYVFGRGGEEKEYLEQQGIRVHVVPGITAAAGIGAELGIPLTHRGIAHSVRFLTGHLRDGLHAEIGDVPPGTTLVIYMGLSLLVEWMETLAQRGLSSATPAVAVERGTTPEQRVVWATAADLPEKVHHAQLKSPTLIIIGDVVALAPGFRLSLQETESMLSEKMLSHALQSGVNSFTTH